MSTPKQETSYSFWVEAYNGEETYWHRLTKRQAKAMYDATSRSNPQNIKRWGWGPSKELRWADLPLNAATTN
jgi:hypothetical protein